MSRFTGSDASRASRKQMILYDRPSPSVPSSAASSVTMKTPSATFSYRPSSPITTPQEILDDPGFFTRKDSQPFRRTSQPETGFGFYARREHRVVHQIQEGDRVETWGQEAIQEQGGLFPGMPGQPAAHLSEMGSSRQLDNAGVSQFFGGGAEPSQGLFSIPETRGYETATTVPERQPYNTGGTEYSRSKHGGRDTGSSAGRESTLQKFIREQRRRGSAVDGHSRTRNIRSRTGSPTPSDSISQVESIASSQISHRDRYGKPEDQGYYGDDNTVVTRSSRGTQVYRVVDEGPSKRKGRKHTSSSSRFPGF